MFKSIRASLSRVRRGSPTPVGPNFDPLFEGFLSGVFRRNKLPAFRLSQTNWNEFDPAAEREQQRANQDWMHRARALGGDSLSVVDDRWLVDEIAAKQREFDALGFRAFAGKHFSFSREVVGLGDPGKDCVYVKLNHGFWEDIYGLFAAAPEQVRRRPRELDFSWESSVGSGFLAALEYLLCDFARPAAKGTGFPNINFALNLTNGMLPNEEIVDTYDRLSPLLQAVGASASVGAAANFQKLFGDAAIHVADGCFPKRSFLDGELRTILTDEAAISDRIIFVVPPHLRNIRLGVAEATRQETIFVSRERAQDIWIASLHQTARHILARLVTGERVLVLAQCGPFAALLGLFLAKAAKDLTADGARLCYLDLGQVTDVANPAESGPWIRNYGFGTDPLFTLASKR